jgi:2,4-dienoyl-CoA reductase (NADPH2)
VAVRVFEPLTDQALVALEDRFAETARLVPEVGFDGEDIKASHGYLLVELLGTHTREGQYEGDYADRTRFIINATEKINRRWTHASH